MKQNVKRVLGSTVAIVALVLVSIWAWATPAPVAAKPVQATEVQVKVDPAGLKLACPPGLIDPDNESQTGVSAALDGDEGEPLEGGGHVVEVHEGSNALRASGAKEGDLATFLLEGCALPSRQLTLLPGSTVTQERTVLVLTNPSANSVEAQVQLFGSLGPLLDAPIQEVVAGESTKVLTPAALAEGQEVIATQVRSDGGGLAAWLQTSGLDGEVSQGVARTPAGSPTKTQVLAGLKPKDANSLIIFNPGQETATAQVSVMTEERKDPLKGASEVKVPAQSVSTVSLSGLEENVTGLLVEADEPLLATASMQRPGVKHDEVSSARYFTRAYLPSSPLLTEAVFPGLGEVKAAAKTVGGEVKDASLVLANPRATKVTVTYGEESLELSSGAAFKVAVPSGEDQGVTSSHPIAVTYLLEVEQGHGTTTVPFPLGGEGSAPEQRFVELFPAR